MDGKTIARIGAVIFVAVAVVATAIEMNRPVARLDAPASSVRPLVTRDPLDEEIVRCSGIGEAGSRDPSCLKAWGQARRRFLGQPASVDPSASATSAAPTTLFPNAPASAHPAMPAIQPEPAKPPVSPDEGAR